MCNIVGRNTWDTCRRDSWIYFRNISDKKVSFQNVPENILEIVKAKIWSWIKSQTILNAYLIKRLYSDFSNQPFRGDVITVVFPDVDVNYSYITNLTDIGISEGLKVRGLGILLICFRSLLFILRILSWLFLSNTSGFC